MDSDDERLLDLWLDQALAGSAEGPEAFCARHGKDGAMGSELRKRIERLAHLAPVRRPQPERAAAASGLPFERLGEFRLLRRLGEGGMGQVFLAEQEPLGRHVALKILRAELKGSPSAAVRLLREARAVAKLKHPNVVTLHAAGETDGVLWLAFELLPGRSLAEMIDAARAAARPLPVRDVVKIGLDVARALAAAHASGLIHRDVKPANVHVTPDGRAALLDFGLARARDGEHGDPTITATFVGSAAYASPEQVDPAGREIDVRTDVYSLGATLYEALSLAPPFRGDTMERVLHAVLTRDPPPLASVAPGVGKDLALVVEHALEKDRERRYATASAFAVDLESVIELRPVSARPLSALRRVTRLARRQPALATIAVAALLATLALFAWNARGRSVARDRARQIVATTSRRIRDYEMAARDAAAAHMRTVGFSRVQQWVRLDAAQEAKLAEAEAKESAFERGREQLVAEILASLREAQALDPAIDVATVLSDLERTRTLEAMRRGEFSDAKSSVPSDARLGDCAIDITVTPADAEVHLFRVRSLAELDATAGGGEPREVPCPPDAAGAGEWPIAPGTLALRVVVPAGDLGPEDLVLAVQGRSLDDSTIGAARALAERGGVRARILRAGASAPADVDLPAGLALRATAIPFVLGAATRVPSVGRIPVNPGRHVIVARRAAHETFRLPLVVRVGASVELDVRLSPLGTTPPGFVRVACDAFSRDRHAAYFIQEREVTSGEFREFLAATGHARDGSQPATEGGARDDHPVLGVSYRDALAFVAWRNANAPPPAGYAYDLPTYHEFIQAGIMGGETPYVYGATYRQSWQKSRTARRGRVVEPVLSYPRDESLHGVFDLMGGAMEWLSQAAYLDDGPERALGGGSWLHSRPDDFRIDLRHAALPETADPAYGFRLVLAPLEGRR